MSISGAQIAAAVSQLALYPDLPREREGKAWYTLFAHARNFCTDARGNVICKYVRVMERHSIAHVYVVNKEAKTMESRTCRLCKSDIAANRAISLFSPRSVQQNLSTRFTQLLGVNIHANDGLPPHVCERCRRQLERLEGAMQDLES